LFFAKLAYCKEEEEGEEDDYEPFQNQYIQVLNDENFEQITNICKFYIYSTANLNGSDTWFIFFTKNDNASKIIEEELQTLVNHTRLYHVKVGMVYIDDSPNTMFRFHLNKQHFSLALFKSKIGGFSSNS
jgi:hypothetical protein